MQVNWGFPSQCCALSFQLLSLFYIWREMDCLTIHAHAPLKQKRIPQHYWEIPLKWFQYGTINRWSSFWKLIYSNNLLDITLLRCQSQNTNTVLLTMTFFLIAYCIYTKTVVSTNLPLGYGCGISSKRTAITYFHSTWILLTAYIVCDQPWEPSPMEDECYNAQLP